MFKDFEEEVRIILKNALIKANNVDAINFIEKKAPKLLDLQLNGDNSFCALCVSDIIHIFTDRNINNFIYCENAIENNKNILFDLSNSKYSLMILNFNKLSLDKVIDYCKNYKDKSILYGCYQDTDLYDDALKVTIIGLK